jgi:hypothetical protein
MTVKLTTRDGWWKFRDVIAKREDFSTHGALRGEFGPFISTGQLPADWRNLLQIGADYVIYSYGTPIAWHRPADDLWIMPDEKYSVTTSRHQSKIFTAIAELGMLIP